MMSRIISGCYGGLYIKSPRHAVRPTTGIIKEYIFNVLQSLEGRFVLDLFSGSGALGIEALSRYARHVTFVDQHPGCIGVIRKNLESIAALPDSWTSVKANAFRYLEQSKEKYDLILADPPYDLSLPAGFFTACRDHLKPNGIFVLEYSTHKSFDSGSWEAFKNKKTGDTGVWIFHA
jgi:16S rRNA (guanine(966)-N(2))-methyltransferase RsmD